MEAKLEHSLKPRSIGGVYKEAKSIHTKLVLRVLAFLLFDEQAQKAKMDKEQEAALISAEAKRRVFEKSGSIVKSKDEEEAEKKQAEESAKLWAKEELQRASSMIQVSSNTRQEKLKRMLSTEPDTCKPKDYTPAPPAFVTPGSPAASPMKGERTDLSAIHLSSPDVGL
eukprot:1179094-Prorocentrum_minimum.AAC.2